jgi:hypothetical protein
MLHPPLVRQHVKRDRFLGRVARAGRVYGAVSEQGLTRVPSRQLRCREVSLLWSDEADAERWAATACPRPRVRSYRLCELLSGVLPDLAQHHRLVGLDTSGRDGPVEIDPTDFAGRLRLASLDAFIDDVRGSAAVFTLEGSDGPALLVSKARPDVLVLPCWADPGEAHARIEGPWRDMLVIEMPLAAFLQERLAWLKRYGHLVGPDYKGGPGALELQPDALQARFARAVS